METTGQNVRKIYQRRLPSNPAKDYYYIMRDTPLYETAIVEYGFADSTGDDVDELKNNWESLAEGVVKAITDYVGGKYIAPIGSNYYTVKLGDSLYSIAKKYNTNVDTLKSLNKLNTDVLSIGQILTLPSINNKVTYVVIKGDNLYNIASKFKTTVSAISELNNLSTSNLSIGQTLLIP